MQATSIIILIWIYAVSIFGFLNVFKIIIGLDTPLLELSIIVSLIGIGLGFIFYGFSLLKVTIRRYMQIGILFGILLIILITYLGIGMGALIDLLIFLGKIGLFLSICSVSLFGAYAVLKKQKNTIISSGLGMLFLFFFMIILSKRVPMSEVPFYSVDQVVQLLLFFVLLMFYLELGTTSVYFDSVIEKMTPDEDNNEFMLNRFNRVFNRYLIQIPVVLAFCFIVPLIIFWNGSYINQNEFIGISLTSVLGVFLLVVIAIIGVFLFWYVIPREKTEKS